MEEISCTNIMKITTEKRDFRTRQNVTAVKTAKLTQIFEDEVDK
jgi:hypothetical protein